MIASRLDGIPASASTGIDVEVAVVGAGPAGAVAASLLAERGLSVRLYERERLPRYKTCGGGVLARAVRGSAMARLLGPPTPEASHAGDRLREIMRSAVSSACEDACHAAELIVAGRAFRAEREEPVVYMTMRDRLDAALVDGARSRGVEVVDGCAIQAVMPGESRVALTTDQGPATARWLIGADGVGGVVARSGGWPSYRQRVAAVEYEMAFDAATVSRWQGVARFDFDAIRGGYAWVFPKARHLSVGAGALRGRVNLHEAVARYAARIGLGEPLSVERHGFAIPVGPRNGRLARGRVLLVGDAAGLADPLTGEGITLSAASGAVAALAIDGACEGRAAPAAVAQRYHRLLRAGLMAELRAAERLSRLMYGLPAIRDNIFADRGQRLAEKMTNLVYGEATYRDWLPSPRRWLASVIGSSAA